MERNKFKEYLIEKIKKYSTEVSLITSDVDEEFELIRDLKVASVRIIDLVLEVEEDFDIELSPDDMDNMFTLKETIDLFLLYINQKLK